MTTEKVTIAIDTVNAAFENLDEELARILRKLADDIENGKYPDNLRDVNGNKVGKVSWE